MLIRYKKKNIVYKYCKEPSKYFVNKNGSILLMIIRSFFIDLIRVDHSLSIILNEFDSLLLELLSSNCASQERKDE